MFGAVPLWKLLKANKFGPKIVLVHQTINLSIELTNKAYTKMIIVDMRIGRNLLWRASFSLLEFGEGLFLDFFIALGVGSFITKFIKI